MKQHEHQVQLTKLLFGLSWEDPNCDREALKIRAGSRLVTVTSGGCNALTFLLDDPREVLAIDINAGQSYILELKRAAIQQLHHGELLAFLGVTPSNKRLSTLEGLSAHLSSEAASYWFDNQEAVRHGIVSQGRYEKFIGVFSHLVRFIQGRNRVEGLFKATNMADQKRYYDEKWNTVRWRWLFRAMFNKRILARQGLTAEYFQFDDGSASFAESFFRKAAHVLCDLPLKNNYFVARYLLGRYRDSTIVPDYLKAENILTVRRRLDRLTVISGDLQGWLRSQNTEVIDGFSLSNICELMSLEETERLFQEVARTASEGARVCFRNLIVKREIPRHLQSIIRLDSALSQSLTYRDRSFVYSKTQALSVFHSATLLNS